MTQQRESMGVLFLLHGLYLKVFVFGRAGAGKYFASLGLPDWFAWVVVLYETIGGLALIKGGGYEFPVFWAIACFALALIGSGAHALKPEARTA